MKTKIIFFTDLNAWKKGHELVINIYILTKNFPKEEIFGITAQMRRSAISITSNIAEGFSRYSYKDKMRFYSMAQGSVTELQNQLLIAKDVELIINMQEYESIYQLSVTVHKIINGLIKSSRMKVYNDSS